jgi:hypothetical protein
MSCAKISRCGFVVVNANVVFSITSGGGLMEADGPAAQSLKILAGGLTVLVAGKLFKSLVINSLSGTDSIR